MTDSITDEDDKFVEDLVMHFLNMIGEHEYNVGHSFCFTSQMKTKDGRILTIDLRGEDE